MKKTVLFTLVLFSMLSYKALTQDTIPNSGFETWYGSSYPADWQTSNLFLPPGTFTCNQTNNSYEGEYALQMKTIDYEGSIIPAVATLGELGIGYTCGGTAFTSRPVALSGYIIHPAANDLVMIAVQFYKKGTEIGGGLWSTTDSIPDYTQFIIDISFTSTDDPDTMNITILTDINIIGSSLTIDALKMEYPITDVNDAIIEKSGIYPNPCQNHLFIDTDIEEPYSYKIINAIGNTVQSQSRQTKKEINTSTLTPGFYLLILETERDIYSKKFVKTY